MASRGEYRRASGLSRTGTTPARKRSAAKRKAPAEGGFIAPMLATLVQDAPTGSGWLHEIKFDGYRLQCILQQGRARLFTRTGLDWTDKFEHLAQALSRLQVEDAIIDGEAVVLDDTGRSSMRLLRRALSEERSDGMCFYAFDLLRLNGRDLRADPLVVRKEHLAQLLQESPQEAVRFSDHIEGKGAAFHRQVCGMGLEGMIAKHRDSVYESGRSLEWRKVKCLRREAYSIIGYRVSSRQAHGLQSLLLAERAPDGTLTYKGKVGTGFNQTDGEGLMQRLQSLHTEIPPVTAVPRPEARQARWVRPELLCEVEYLEETEDGLLRHPSFKGLVDSKRLAVDGMKAPAASVTSDHDHARYGGVTLTHPDKALYADGTRKRDLAEYYEAVADFMLPHVVGRPISILRCPSGGQKHCFFQRHLQHPAPAHLYPLTIPDGESAEPFFTLRDAAGLISLVQIGTLEIHCWGSQGDRPDLPDRLVFDLDPDETVAWPRVVEAAFEVRQRLQDIGLESFVKTTGGKGLHVVAPIERKHGWETVAPFTRALAEAMVHDSPKAYLAKMSKAARAGKIFIDYLRNDLAASAVAPYSTRNREGVTVATPLAWTELSGDLRADSFTIHQLPKRLLKLRQDPWQDMLTLKQGLTAKALRIVR